MEETVVDENGVDGTEEQIDIDLEDPEVEAAANKIQASFKGHQARKQVKKMKQDEIILQESQDTKIESAQAEGLDKKVQAHYTTDEDLAAAKIQAGYRGMKVRQNVGQMRTEVMHDVIEEEEDGVVSEENEDAANLKDQSDEEKKEMEQAATKIQAGYRGMKTRKDLRKTDKVDTDLPGEAEATEMMIEGAAQAREEDEGAQSQLDDGYISPENPTWKSSNTACIQNSSPSSVNSSPTKHIDSSLSAAMAGNSLNLSSAGLSPGCCYDFDEDDTPRSILIEEQDIFEGGYEVFKIEEENKESMSHLEETDTESQTVIADIRTFVKSGNDVEAPAEDFTDEEGPNLTAEISQPPSLSPCHFVDETANEEIETGAIPFELHPSYNDPVHDEEDEGEKEKCKEKTDECNVGFIAEEKSQCENSEGSDDIPIIIYHSVGSYNCEKVLMYLHERGIPFQENEVHLKNNEQVNMYHLRLFFQLIFTELIRGK